MNLRFGGFCQRPELVRACRLVPLRWSRPFASRITASDTATLDRETEEQQFHRREGSGAFSSGQWRVQFKRDKSLPCQRCGGAGKLICSACDGTARLGRGGYHEKNPVMSARLVGSKWTAMERTLGWRHFHVTAKRKAAGETFVCLVSTCGQHNSAGATLWLNSAVLKSRRAWAPGWLQRTEINEITGETAGTECKVCAGRGNNPCLLCSSGGETISL